MLALAPPPVPAAAPTAHPAGQVALAGARLEGRFLLSGQVTAATNVHGEHRGQRVMRSWTFLPLCATGPCQTIRLTRQRVGGTDTLVLQQRGLAQYTGNGRFFAPLRCAGRVYPHGELVPFTISVRVTAARQVGGGSVAVGIRATYASEHRVNRTACILPPASDAAMYQGRLT